MRRSRGPWLALGLFILLAVAHTWPLASAPGRLGRNFQADTQLNAWTMAWVAHQVVHDPLHLFDANIFYPERHTLAFSEHLFVQSMMGAPVRWAGGSPILVYNLIFIAGMALTGWAMAVVIHRWTASWTAGVLSGSLIAFNALTLTRFPHIQMQHLEFLPFALLALDELLMTPRLKHAVQLALWFVLQSLTSLYFLVFTSIVLCVSAAARPEDWRGPRVRQVLPMAGAAALLSAVVLSPFLLPYLQARGEQEMFVRTLDQIGRFSASWVNYLATGGTFHIRTWSAPFWVRGGGDGLFPGVVGLAMTIVAMATGVAFADKRARMALVFGVVCFCLSFGPAFPLYKILYTAFPAMAAVRGAARFGHMVLAAVAILAGFGFVALQRRLPRAWALPVGLVLVLVANLEALRAPIDYGRDQEFHGIPKIFETLNTPAPDVVAIFPFYGPQELFKNARYMMVSTVFWKPMLNGYSGYMPVRYIEHTQNLGGFPDERSIAYLREIGVTKVLVDSRNMPEPALMRLPLTPALSLVDSDGNLHIFELKR
ncbi:MAG: hypothetical protein ND807_00650 [Vicinamibacterales bacterium]|nr:hypothetical protein [Vicinamibacterales bacterium]